MFLQWLWVSMMGASLIFALTTGQSAAMLPSALNAASDAISLTIRLGAGYLFFCGMMEIASALRLPQKLTRLIQPLLVRLMPGIGGAAQSTAMNLAMNVLGLGNAATPCGMEAMRQMDEERSTNPVAGHAMYMLLILNATGLQLLPTTVLAMRSTAGSADTNAVILPTIACTVFSTLVGAGLGLCARRKWGKKKR